MHGIKARLKAFLIVFCVVIVLGTIGFMAIEGKRLIDAFYFVIVTMATVGYGDIHPVTDWGKIFSVVLIIVGVGTFLGVIANLTEIVLAKREVQSRMEKLNMVIGAFFSEVGTGLLADFARFDSDFDAIRPAFIITARWTDSDFLKAGRESLKHDYGVDMERVDVAILKALLLTKRDFMVRLLENPVLLEHQSFTDLLRAVFHLTEELSYRSSFDKMPKADREHLALDIKRAYHLLANEWITYMRYLKQEYPFLFSLAMRTNPFDKDASVMITDP